MSDAMSEAVMTARLIRLRTWLRNGCAYIEDPESRDEYAADSAETIDAVLDRLAATLAELEQLRQDALRWRAIRPSLELRTENDGYSVSLALPCPTLWIGADPEDFPQSVDDAADHLAQVAALKEEKGNG